MNILQQRKEVNNYLPGSILKILHKKREKKVRLGKYCVFRHIGALNETNYIKNLRFRNIKNKKLSKIENIAPSQYKKQWKIFHQSIYMYKTGDTFH